MDNYTLNTIVDTPDVLVVRLTPPSGGEMQSTRIAFLPGGYIVIHGDLCPGENGLISVCGYGPGWFANKGRPLTPHYMAEKFRVPSVFIAKRAAEHLRDCAVEEDDPVRSAAFRGLIADANDLDERDDAAVAGFLVDVDAVTGSPDHAEAFYGAEPRTMDLLIRIQAAFARLWTPKETT